MGVANAPVYNMNMPTSSWACYPAIRPGRAPREGSRRLGAALAYVEATMKCVSCHKYVRRVKMMRAEDARADK